MVTTYHLQDGMGKLRLTEDGVRLEGVAEFVEPIITSNITSDEVRVLAVLKFIFINTVISHSVNTMKFYS